MPTTIAHSSYLDYTGYGTTDAHTVREAYDLSPSDIVAPTAGINIALILPRMNDPTALLESNWALRQQTIANLGSGIWDTYGANSTNFTDMVADLQGRGMDVLGLTNSQSDGAYVSSAESRTIWVNFTAQQFHDFFGQDLHALAGYADNANYMFWDDHLSLPDDWNAAWQIDGLWVDGDQVPDGTNMAGSATVPLPQGPQSPGNTLGDLGNNADVHPQRIAGDYYNFPLNGEQVATGSVAFVEPGIGTALDGLPASDFQHLLEEYRHHVQVTGTGQAYGQGLSGQSWADASGGAGERSLDVGIFTAINPNSDIGIYAGSGYNADAWAEVFTAYQSAIWMQPDAAPVGWQGPAVISSSWGSVANPDPDSPFYRAYAELFVDAALRNQTMLVALGDGGSGNEQANGLTNVGYNDASPYAVLVGGTSISTPHLASQDETLTTMLQLAAAQDRGVLWQLIAGGLLMMPQNATGSDTFVETVWNEYYVDGDHLTSGSGYQENNTSSGGVDTTQDTPSYQLDYGLTPTTTTSPNNGQGRGLPDVAANAGGNMFYVTPNGDMIGTTGEGGTSAATPLWAALVVQFNAIFSDMGLPQLGYMNDLLYQAAAIAPGAFNDITIGTNMSSYYVTDTQTPNSYRSDGQWITPTGYGFEAAPGYDLVSGLGSPNGTLLARALVSVAENLAHYTFNSSVIVEDPLGSGLVSGANQTVLFQTDFSSSMNWALTLEGSAVSYNAGGSTAYAWNSLFAQKVLQADFSSDLVTLFDGFAQGSLYQASVSAGEGISIAIGGHTADLPQINMTTAFGFVDFVSDSGTSAVTVARPVAIAETVGDADDQNAVVRIRQNGMNDSSLVFYKVDDFNGTINGIAPGQPGYAEAVAARAYHTDTGGTSVSGAGYGQYSQTQLVGVDGGDHVAMVLTSGGHTYYAFAQANENVDGQHVGHIWSYGLNTWGWEDLYGGGDKDYNDMVVQLDFQSAYGNGWLV